MKASEPPKLDLDDEEAEDDGPSHNTSRDSALSTTSNFSSVASECVLIEDVAKVTTILPVFKVAPLTFDIFNSLHFVDDSLRAKP